MMSVKTSQDAFQEEQKKLFAGLQTRLQAPRPAKHSRATSSAIAMAAQALSDEEESDDDEEREEERGGATVEFGFVAINLAKEEEVELDLRVSGCEAVTRATRAAVWVLSAPSLSSSIVTINGAEPVASPDGTLPDLPPCQLSREGSVLVPPRSIAFVRLALRVDDD